jgi:Molybdopterin converting factor, large subunit
MIRVTRDSFDIGALTQKSVSPDTGAIVTFLGTVRDDGIRCIELEAYEEVAVRELTLIRDEAMERFDIKSVEIIHRIGLLDVTDPIVCILVGAGHRKAAFEACEFIIDRIKETVPIWKKELLADGSRWVSGEH